MPTYSIKNFFLTILTYFFLVFSITHLSLPFFADILLAIIIFIILKKKKLIICTGIIIIVSSFLLSAFWGLKRSEEIYYRPHERYNLPSDKKYIKNINDTFHMPYGDIYYMGSEDNILNLDKIKQQRKIIFKTDKYGYRNNQKLEDAEIILVGDSFIVGNGNSQENLPSNILSKKINKTVANIAYPENPKGYEMMVLENLKVINDRAKIFIFYFEGNDFYNIKAIDFKDKKKSNLYIIGKKTWSHYKKIENLKTIYLTKIYPKDQIFFKLIRIKTEKINYNISKKILKLLKLKNDINKKNVTLINLNGSYLGFFNRYIEETKSENLITHIIENPKILNKIGGIIFIPSKYRVYSDILNDYNKNNSGLNFLLKNYSKKNISVLDLTPAMQKSAKENLPINKYLYWKDDTHWNKLGIEVAMEEVVKKFF